MYHDGHPIHRAPYMAGKTRARQSGVDPSGGSGRYPPGCMEYGQCGRYSRNEGVNSEEASESIIPSALVSRVRELVVQSHRYQEKLERLSAEIDHLNQRISRLNADLGSLRSEKEYLMK